MANLWSFPISIGLSIPHLLQACSHNLSYGQTLAQQPPKILFSLMVSAAPLTFLKRIERINFAGSVPAGQLWLHGASWQRRHLDASYIAVLGLKPATASDVYVPLITLLKSFNSSQSTTAHQLSTLLITYYLEMLKHYRTHIFLLIQ